MNDELTDLVKQTQLDVESAIMHIEAAGDRLREMGRLIHPEPTPPDPTTSDPDGRLRWSDFELVEQWDVPFSIMKNGRSTMEGCAPGFTVSADGGRFWLSRRASLFDVTPCLVEGPTLVLLSPIDVTNGKLRERDSELKVLGEVGAQMGGLLAMDEEMLYTIQPRYNTSGRIDPFLGMSGGLHLPVSNYLHPNNAAGYLTVVPTGWHDVLDGKLAVAGFGHVTSQGSSRSSAGPALHVVHDDGHAETWLYHPPRTSESEGHELDGWLRIPEHWTACAWIERGGRETILFIQAKGLGEQGYKRIRGPLDSPHVNEGGYWASEGYVIEALFYDPSELWDAPNPWEPKPYERVEILDWPHQGTVPRIQGCDVDMHGNLYVSIANGVDKKTPRVHKFALKAGGAT